MVNKVLIKETKNFIKKNLKTYIAQVIIIMLGVGVFVGMKISSIDLQDTMTTFVEDNNFYDLKVNLEYGIEGDDIEELKNVLTEAEYVEAGYSLDVINEVNNTDAIIQVHSYNPDNNINILKLKKGDYPTGTNECVIDTVLNDAGYEIGDEITIESSYLNEKTLTIVGIVQSPEYLSVERGNSLLLSGKINYYIYVNEENINSSVYTDLYIKYDTAYVAFTEAYDDYIMRKEIEATYTISGYYKDKYNEIITEKQINLTAAKAEYEAAKAKIDSQFVDAENEIKNKEELLSDAKSSLMTDAEINALVSSVMGSGKSEQKALVEELKTKMNEAKSAYDSYKKTYDSEMSSVKSQIASNEAKIASLEKSIEENENELASLQSKYNSMSDTTTSTSTESCLTGYTLTDGQCCRTTSSTTSSSYSYWQNYWSGTYSSYSDWYNWWNQNYDTSSSLSCYTPTTTTSSTTNAEKVALLTQINTLSATIAQQKTQKAALETENVSLNKQLTSSSKLTTLENAYNQAKAEYEEQLEIYNSMSSSSSLTKYYKNQNAELKKLISQYETEIADAKADLSEKKTAAYSELAAAEEEIQNAEDLINMLSYPNSYIYTRQDNSGYSQFVSDVEKISNLAIIVPVIFYCISFFMISASIGRMLNEERNQIGTLKAIGIRDKEIMIKYLIYSISSVIIGSILGILIGIVILPLLVYFIYEMLYEFPTYSLTFNLRYYLIASGLALIVAVVSTIISCEKTFAERPVALLKAKQEKAATDSIFEKFPRIWNHISLTTKISIKNIFRYKVRMLMTVIGIGGCLALILTGLSIRTSITGMIPAQYGGIFDADAQIFMKDSSLRSELAAAKDSVEQIEEVDSVMTANYQTFSSDYSGKTLSVNVMAITDENYKDYISLNDYKTKETLELSNEGVIISEKLAKLQDINVGDVIKIKDSEQQEYSFIVSGIAENYIEHYIYMNSEYYEKVFGEEPRNNFLIIKMKKVDYDELAVASAITENDAVSQVMFISVAEEAYDKIINNLALLVAVFIVFSVLLVFAVLYNLININIRERSKEIATYKVLGFKNNKIISIVKRENIVLMIIGVIFGLIFGYFLALIVIETCETENLNFLKTITTENCLISAMLTIAITLIFSLMINKYVKTINLTESLKSNE